jgi:dipeptidase E
MHLLLLSNSRQHGRGFLEHARDALVELVPRGRKLAFVPYALDDHDAYTQVVRDAVADLGITVCGVHESVEPCDVVAASDAVFIGGGNTFRLLKQLYATGLLETVREMVATGLPYIGSSAGTNVACPTIRTTNDMPIVQPPSFRSMGLVPFQINAHYVDADPGSTHMGETREKRLEEFLECNEAVVLGLREGGWLRVRDDAAWTGGDKPARVFRRDAAPSEVAPGTRLDGLLQEVPRFDAGQ